MEFKDYYAALGVERGASQDEIKQAYRRLARKYHPDVSKEPDAEARFKDVSEAYEALGDPQRRAAYDEAGRRRAAGEEFRPPPGFGAGPGFGAHAGATGFGDGGFASSAEFSEFFESLFGRSARGFGPMPDPDADGEDHHARLEIDLEDAYRGARRSLLLRVPTRDAQGMVTMQQRQLDVTIPAGVRDGQHLRLAGQGLPAPGSGEPGDLYLEVRIAAHRLFRLDGRDIHLDLPVAPWEAALGATVEVPTPGGSLQLTVPRGSGAGRRLRLKGKGLPGSPPGDLYVVLKVAAPPADTPAAEAAYASLEQAFPRYDPRAELSA
jgi:curved DNA-binding protein